MNDQAERFPHDDASSATENAELERLFARLGELPAPTPAHDLRPGFDTMRAAYEQGLAEGLAADNVRPFPRPQRTAPQQRAAHWSATNGWLAAAAALAVLGLGLVLGRQMQKPTGGTTGNASRETSVAVLRAEIGELSRVVTTTLLDRGTATERLRAIEVARASQTQDDAMTSALLEAALDDPSANVRLAALEALAPLINERAALRMALVDSLARPQPPLVGVAMVDTLLASGAKGRRALQSVTADDLDKPVRKHLESRLGAHL